MRLWSIHPKYLDSKGLVALWREALLAQQVLHGKTSGYRRHPQLIRFRNTGNPEGAIATYLRGVLLEAEARTYRFDRRKILPCFYRSKIAVTSGQIDYEFRHLRKKLETRNPELADRLRSIAEIDLHPLFERAHGDIEPWEVAKS